MSAAFGLSKAADDLRPFDYQFEWSELVDVVNDLLLDISVDTSGAALDDLGEEGAEDAEEALSDWANDWARDRAAEMVGKRWVDGELIDNPDARWVITEPTRTMLKETIGRAVDEGWSPAVLRKELRASYAFSALRAMTISRTEIMRANNEGLKAGWRASGVVAGMRWLTAPGCCPHCQTLNGTVAPLDGVFPDGSEGPPAHPNCRCTIVAVLKREAKDHGLDVAKGRKNRRRRTHGSARNGRFNPAQARDANGRWVWEGGKKPGLDDAGYIRLASDVRAGPVEIARMGRRTAKLIGAKTQAVHMSHDTAAKQIRHHPEVAASDYGRISGMLKKAEVWKDRDRHFVFADTGGDRDWMAVIKVTETGKGTWLVSLRRTDAGDIERLKRRSHKVR